MMVEPRATSVCQPLRGNASPRSRDNIFPKFPEVSNRGELEEVESRTKWWLQILRLEDDKGCDVEA